MMGCPQEIDEGLATQNIQMGEALALPTASQMTNVNPNRWGEPMSYSKEALTLRSGEEVSFSIKYG